MTFSRDDLAAYEKQPQAQVADTQEHILAGATPSKAATAAEAAAAGATNATSAASADTDTAVDPSDGSVESGDPSATGDGTSDENADSSTATADPSSESETTTETVAQPPKKGSAAERIQELLDLTEGYKEYGRLKDDALKEALAELARLKAGDGASTSEKPTPGPTEAAADDPMPDLSDPDVNFDTEKLRIKTAKWIKLQIAAGTKQVVSDITGKTAAQKLEADVNAKFAAFAATHPDWDTKVANNQVLIKNQLSPVASLVLAKSEHAADIVYAFGNDPALAIKTSKQTPEEQLVTLGKIVAKIEAAKEASAATSSAKPADKSKPVDGAKPAKQKSLTQAPPPPTAVKAAGRPTEREETDPTLSMDDFARRHREKKQTARSQMRKARGLG